MPAYKVGTAAGVYPGDQVVVIGTTDSVATGFKSQAIALSAPTGRPIVGVRAQVDFNGNPGTFEMDLQESDVDQDNDFQTVASVAATTGAPNYSCYIIYQNPTAKFYRLKAPAMGNTISSGAIGTLSV